MVFFVMPPHLKHVKRAQLALILYCNESPKEISAALHLSLPRIYHYRNVFNIHGTPFPYSHSNRNQNATVLTPHVMERVLQLLKTKPDLFLDEIQHFLVEEYSVWVTTITISRHLREEQ
ncbi:hypothetical protein QBC44DRAFT_338032 [Cladorrhinum sp. PSN332]|nr:hypothetical protein QBC44DRAFT_338032 [Cladorrhinum sp. PSN332]